MKKLLIIKAIALLVAVMLISLTSNAQHRKEPMFGYNNKPPKSGGYNYHQNQVNKQRYYKKQIYRMRNQKNHVCSGHRYKK